jgi:hypothetical protein
MSGLTRHHAFRALAALVLAFVFALLFAVVASCSGPKTSVTQVWQATVSPAPMKRVLVFAAKMDEANRRALEDSLVAELAKHDVAARPSYELFPGEPPEPDKAREAVKNAGFDGILVAHLKSVREKQTYVSGAYGGPFWTSYYGSGWGSYSPGYVVTDEVVRFETTLWDTRADDKLAWAMSSETTNPSAGRDFVRSLTKAVIGGLEKARVIPPSR